MVLALNLLNRSTVACVYCKSYLIRKRETAKCLCFLKIVRIPRKIIDGYRTVFICNKCAYTSIWVIGISFALRIIACLNLCARFCIKFKFYIRKLISDCIWRNCISCDFSKLDATQNLCVNLGHILTNIDILSSNLKAYLLTALFVSLRCINFNKIILTPFKS